MGDPYRARVITASNRASAGVYEDRGGPILAEGLRSLGFTVDGPHVVPERLVYPVVQDEAVDPASQRGVARPLEIARRFRPAGNGRPARKGF